MGSPDPFAAEIVSSCSGALAGLASERLAREHAGSRAFAVRPFAGWKENLAGRLGDLASALAAGRPELFAEQVGWAKAAFEARGVAVEDLEASLRSLRSVLAEELPESARGGALACIDLALERCCRRESAAPTFLATDTPHGRLAASFLLAVLEGDRAVAVGRILEAADAGMTVRELYGDVLAPVQREIGRLWHQAEVSVAEEHFATTTTAIAMSALYPRLPRRAANGRSALIACVEGNAHDLGARMIADYLEMDGWKAVFLGASVPAEDLARGAVDFAPDVVALSASLPSQIGALDRSIRAVRESAATVRILIGGALVEQSPGLASQLGADGQAESAEAGVTLANRLAAGTAC